MGQLAAGLLLSQVRYCCLIQSVVVWSERGSWDMNMTPWPSLSPAGTMDRVVP